MKEKHYTQNVIIVQIIHEVLVKAGQSISVYQCIFYADCEIRNSSNKASVRDVFLNDCLRIKAFVECANKLYLEVCDLIFTINYGNNTLLYYTSLHAIVYLGLKSN